MFLYTAMWYLGTWAQWYFYSKKKGAGYFLHLFKCFLND